MKLKKLIKTVLIVFSLAWQSISFAESVYSGGIKVSAIATYIDGLVLFNVVGTLPSTCDYYGFRVKFDANKVGGRNMLATLLTAKTQGKTIGFSYEKSTAQDNSNVTTGCSLENMASSWSMVIE